MNRYLTKSQKYDFCKNHPLFARKPVELAPNLPHENGSIISGCCAVPGCWHNKPTHRIPFPAPHRDRVDVWTAANGKEGFQESSGPEARETPRSSSSLVINGQSSITPWGKKHRRQYQRLMTLLYRWEVMVLSIVRLDLTTALGGNQKLLTKHLESRLNFQANAF